MSRLREEQKAPMSRLRKEQKAPMSRLREEQKALMSRLRTAEGCTEPRATRHVVLDDGSVIAGDSPAVGTEFEARSGTSAPSSPVARADRSSR
jgi:hypothetical protein